MPANTAAWLPAKGVKLEVGPAPYTAPGAGEIVVENRAVAINPVDWAIPLFGQMIFPWIKRPMVLGEDVAGVVVEVGPGVTRFKVGDRVVGHALGIKKEHNRPAEGAFQAYTVLVETMAAPIPDSLAFENAAVLPLGLSTAACGLFQKDYLGLRLPSKNPAPTGKTLLVWGGSTSVGSNAIQLAVAAGYEVFTTASPRNFDYVKRLGASAAFDYNARSAVADVIGALKGKTIAGALAIGEGSGEACMDIVHACQGHKFVANASAPVSLASLPDSGGMSLSMIARFLAYNVSMAIKSRTRGVRAKFIMGDSLASNEVGRAIYADFLPGALADGRFVAAPDPIIVGQGLGQIQAAFDIQRKGVSAKKVVVSL